MHASGGCRMGRKHRGRGVGLQAWGEVAGSMMLRTCTSRWRSAASAASCRAAASLGMARLFTLQRVSLLRTYTSFAAEPLVIDSLLCSFAASRSPCCLMVKRSVQGHAGIGKCSHLNLPELPRYCSSRVATKPLLCSVSTICTHQPAWSPWQPCLESFIFLWCSNLAPALGRGLQRRGQPGSSRTDRQDFQADSHSWASVVSPRTALLEQLGRAPHQGRSTALPACLLALAPSTACCSCIEGLHDTRTCMFIARLPDGFIDFVSQGCIQLFMLDAHCVLHEIARLHSCCKR